MGGGGVAGERAVEQSRRALVAVQAAAELGGGAGQEAADQWGRGEAADADAAAAAPGPWIVMSLPRSGSAPTVRVIVCGVAFLKTVVSKVMVGLPPSTSARLMAPRSDCLPNSPGSAAVVTT